MTQITGLMSPFLEKQRLNQVLKVVHGNKIDILDIGCGKTKLPKILKDGINSYTGFDLLKNVIDENKKQFPEHLFYCQDILKFDIKNKRFNYILMLAFIEHLTYSDTKVLFKKLKSLLKPNDKIIITTPHKKTQKIHEFRAKIGFFSNEAAHEHKCFFDKELLYRLAKESDLKIKSYKKFQFGLNQLCIYENI